MSLFMTYMFLTPLVWDDTIRRETHQVVKLGRVNPRENIMSVKQELHLNFSFQPFTQCFIISWMPYWLVKLLDMNNGFILKDR
jgi:hypothetical protein